MENKPATGMFTAQSMFQIYQDEKQAQRKRDDRHEETTNKLIGLISVMQGALEQQKAETDRLRDENRAMVAKMLEQQRVLLRHIDAIPTTIENPRVKYEYRRETWCTPETRAQLERDGWQVCHMTDMLVIGNTGTGSDDDICTVVHFRKPTAPPTAPETDAAEKDLSLFENALPDPDDTNPNDTQEVEVIVDDSETEPVIVKPEKEPAPVGYINVTASGCYLRGTHLQGNVYADVETMMIPVCMIERDRKTGRYKVSLENSDVIDMGGHDDLYRKVANEPDTPTTLEPAPDTTRISLGIGDDGKERYIENRVVWAQYPGNKTPSMVDQEGTRKLRKGAVDFAVKAVIDG